MSTPRHPLSLALLASTALAAPALAQDAAPARGGGELLPPVQLHAGGDPIDMGDLVGYAGPSAYDHDGDGKLDLLVGSFDGKIRFYRNTGSNTDPVYAPGTFLKAEGEDIHISNW